MPANTSQFTIREIVDPQQQLPTVTLVEDEEYKKVQGSLVPARMLIQAEGKTIGRATFMEDKGREIPEAWFNGVEIEDPNYLGRGFGTAAYLAAIELAHSRGEVFRTHDWTQTEAAVRVWQRFIESGIAEVVSPFTPLTGDEDIEFRGNKFIGHIRIPPGIK